MIIRLVLFLFFFGTLLSAPTARCQTWQERFVLIDSLRECGATDSAKTLFRQVVLSEESRFSRSDSTVDVRVYQDGVSRYLYLRNLNDAVLMYTGLAKISENLFGANSRESAFCLRRLGSALDVQGKYREAVSTYRRALAASDAGFGTESSETVGILNDVGEVLIKLGRYAEADSASTRARRITEQTLGTGHPEMARSLQITGEVMLLHSAYAEADSVFRSSLEILESELGPDHPDVAACLCRIGTSCRMTGKNAEAQTALERSLEIREAYFGPNHPEVANSLGHLGWYYRQTNWSQSDAEQLLVRAIDILKKAYGPYHPETALEIVRLSSLKSGQAQFEISGELASQALPALEEAFGRNHRHVAFTLSLLAHSKNQGNQIGESIELFERATSIMEAGEDSTNLQLAWVLRTLGRLYSGTGRDAEAESALLRAYSLTQRVGDSGYLATTAISVGDFYFSQMQPSEAKIYYQTALSITTDLYEGKHPVGVFSLLGVADCLRLEGDIEQSESFLFRALSIAREVFDTAGANYAMTILSAAEHYLYLGEFAQAEPLFREGHTILENTVGPDSYHCSESLRRLGQTNAALHRYQESLTCYRKLFDIRHRQIRIVFASTSEQEKVRYLLRYSPVFHDLLSLTLSHPTEGFRELSLEMILKGKAIVEESSLAEKQAAICSRDDDITDMLLDLRQLHNETANLVLSGGSDKDRLAYLYAAQDSIEAELSRRCSEFKTQLGFRDFVVSDVAQALPESTVLIEYFLYSPFDSDSVKDLSDESGNSAERYVAATLDHDGNISITDLGPAQCIDSLVESARHLIYETHGVMYSSKAVVAEARLNETTTRLREIVIDPLKAHFDDKTDLYISPDGVLNLLPFEILPVSDDLYLIETYDVTYLSSGRDLLRYDHEAEVSQNVVVMADPDFDRSAVAHTETFSLPASDGELPPSYTQLLRGTDGCLDGRMGRLGYSLHEGKGVADSFRRLSTKSVTELYGRQASEDNLKLMKSTPGVLHLATHGYFCPYSENLSEHYENPLLRSGLVLAGYNRTIDDVEGERTIVGEDGVLTAFEVSGLNLEGTELVTLSACESGLGEGYTSTGLYGLRRAFQHAGAQSVILSLWKVPDRETELLMEGFYDAWLSGSSKHEALRQSALGLLQKCREEMGCGHPLFWGGFILTGNPN